jgi:hypothetical protein
MGGARRRRFRSRFRCQCRPSGSSCSAAAGLQSAHCDANGDFDRHPGRSARAGGPRTPQRLPDMDARHRRGTTPPRRRPICASAPARPRCAPPARPGALARLRVRATAPTARLRVGTVTPCASHWQEPASAVCLPRDLPAVRVRSTGTQDHRRDSRRGSRGHRPWARRSAAAARPGGGTVTWRWPLARGSGPAGVRLPQPRRTARPAGPAVAHPARAGAGCKKIFAGANHRL